jgi:NAD(P)-dependent dehydrogenase (short-subunit alcohol dehydrogenase family)
VTLAVRNTDAGVQTAADITATTRNHNIHVAPLDLSDRDSIAKFVAAWNEPLHILVNNAGVMASPEQHTPEGWEMQFATNHLGHFALAIGLHDALAEDGAARIVFVSSSGHLMSPVVFDDIHFAFRPHDPWLAYGQSKTANILFAVGATARWFRHGITANALMPGAIATNLQRHIGGMPLTPPEQQKTPEQARRPPFCWRPLRSWRASAGATSRTATKPPSLQTATAIGVALLPTPSIRTTPKGSGRNRCA